MAATAAPSTAADEVLELIADLSAAVDARSKVSPMLAVILGIIFLRLGRLRAGLARLVARIRAGKPPRARTPRPRPLGVAARVRKPIAWPRKFRALAEMLGDDAAQYETRLRDWLATPEAVAFIVANPDCGRQLRPLCRDLGVRLIPELRRRRIPRRPATPPIVPSDESIGEPAVARIAEPPAAASEPPPPRPAPPAPASAPAASAPADAPKKHHYFVEASAMPFTPTHLTRKRHWHH